VCGLWSEACGKDPYRKQGKGDTINYNQHWQQQKEVFKKINKTPLTYLILGLNQNQSQMDEMIQKKEMEM